MLQSLSSKRKKIINPTQWGKLFPSIPSSVSSASFDITLLMVLLRNICGLVEPATGWDVLPCLTDVNREADIARIKYFRNTVFAHAERASVDDATFKSHWQSIRECLERLGGVQYRAAIDRLETVCMDPEAEEHYIGLLLSGFARLLNDVEMEIYKPRRVAYQVQECVLGKIVEFDPRPHLTTPDEEKYSPIATLWCLQDPQFPFVDYASYTPEGIIKIRSGKSIAVSEKTGNIAVAQIHNPRVHLFSESNLLLRTIGHEGTGADLIDLPRSVAFTSSGNIVVVHCPLQSTRKLSVFTQRGHHITDLSKHLLNPRCVSVRNDGKLLVCDGFSVKVLSPDGANLMQTVKAPFCDKEPCFAIHHQGNFFVSYDSLHCVKVFSDGGQLLYEIGCKGTGDGQLRCPEGLAIDKLNNLVVCDKENNRLQFFSLEGKFVNSVTKDISRPESVAVAKNGDLLFCRR